MKKTGYIFLIVNIVVLVLWLVPTAWQLVTARMEASPFTLYSATIHDFTTMDVDTDGNYTFTDTHGHKYAGSGAERVQAFFYCQDLAARGLLPDSVEGKPVNLDMIERNKFILSLSPADFNKPAVKAWLLLESKPHRGHLSAPAEGFYSTGNGLAVVRLKDNTVNKQKSAQFTAALFKAGFTFPVAQANGNPDAKKDYDEGYILTDSNGKLFHFKQQQGQCYARSITLPARSKVAYALMVENPNRRIRAFVASQDHRFYIVDADYQVHDTGIPFNADTEDMLAIGDPCYITIKVGSLQGERFYALNATDYRLKDTLSRPYADSKTWMDYVMPLRILMKQYNSQYVFPRLHWAL